jgi:hypothetical protein
VKASETELSFLDCDTSLTLPFFSVVSVRAAAQRLAGFGFRASVAVVRDRH